MPDSALQSGDRPEPAMPGSSIRKNVFPAPALLERRTKKHVLVKARIGTGFSPTEDRLKGANRAGGTI
jgi:hypothetical protein